MGRAGDPRMRARLALAPPGMERFHALVAGMAAPAARRRLDHPAARRRRSAALARRHQRRARHRRHLDHWRPAARRRHPLAAATCRPAAGPAAVGAALHPDGGPGHRRHHAPGAVGASGRRATDRLLHRRQGRAAGGRHGAGSPPPPRRRGAGGAFRASARRGPGAAAGGHGVPRIPVAARHRPPRPRAVFPAARRSAAAQHQRRFRPRVLPGNDAT